MARGHGRQRERTSLILIFALGLIALVLGSIALVTPRTTSAALALEPPDNVRVLAESPAPCAHEAFAPSPLASTVDACSTSAPAPVLDARTSATALADDARDPRIILHVHVATPTEDGALHGILSCLHGPKGLRDPDLIERIETRFVGATTTIALPLTSTDACITAAVPGFEPERVVVEDLRRVDGRWVNDGESADRDVTIEIGARRARPRALSGEVFVGGARGLPAGACVRAVPSSALEHASAILAPRIAILDPSTASYTFDELPAGEWELEATSAATIASWTPITLRPSDGPRALDLHLVRGTTLVIELRDARTREPVSACELRVCYGTRTASPPDVKMFRETRRSAITRDDGACAFAALPRETTLRVLAADAREADEPRSQASRDLRTSAPRDASARCDASPQRDASSEGEVSPQRAASSQREVSAQNAALGRHEPSTRCESSSPRERDARESAVRAALLAEITLPASAPNEIRRRVWIHGGDPDDAELHGDVPALDGTLALDLTLCLRVGDASTARSSSVSGSRWSARAPADTACVVWLEHAARRVTEIASVRAPAGSSRAVVLRPLVLSRTRIEWTNAPTEAAGASLRIESIDPNHGAPKCIDVALVSREGAVSCERFSGGALRATMRRPSGTSIAWTWNEAEIGEVVSLDLGADRRRAVELYIGADRPRGASELVLVALEPNQRAAHATAIIALDDGRSRADLALFAGPCFFRWNGAPRGMLVCGVIDAGADSDDRGAQVPNDATALTISRATSSTILGATIAPISGAGRLASTLAIHWNGRRHDLAELGLGTLADLEVVRCDGRSLDIVNRALRRVRWNEGAFSDRGSLEHDTASLIFDSKVCELCPLSR
jgi:hypothetical protein